MPLEQRRLSPMVTIRYIEYFIHPHVCAWVTKYFRFDLWHSLSTANTWGHTATILGTTIPRTTPLGMTIPRTTITWDDYTPSLLTHMLGCPHIERWTTCTLQTTSLPAPHSALVRSSLHDYQSLRSTRGGELIFILASSVTHLVFHMCRGSMYTHTSDSSLSY